MTIEMIVLISGLILVAMLASLFLRRGSSFNSDTTTSYNGRSYESARTAKYDRYG